MKKYILIRALTNERDRIQKEITALKMNLLLNKAVCTEDTIELIDKLEKELLTVDCLISEVK